jgi:alpha-2-macroglobulin
MKKRGHAGLAVSLTLFLVVILSSCGLGGGKRGASRDFDYPSTADPEIVSSHVSGPLSSESRILVRFVDELASPAAVGGKVAQGVAVISPGAPGDMVWADARTIEFKPSQVLPRGRKYTIDVFPRKLDAQRFAESSRFHFSFSVMAQSLSVDTEGFQSAGGSDMLALTFTGSLRTADAADPGMVEKALRAALDGKAMTVEWSHAKLDHRFTVKGIVKQEKPQVLRLFVDGKSIEAGFRKDLDFPVPQRTAFKVVSVNEVESPERRVELSFSDPLLAGQDFRGFVDVTPLQSLRFSVQDMVLSVYALSAWGENAQITVKAGIKNAAGEPLTETVTFPVTFKPLLPAARFIGSGVIVPQKTGVTVPIETVNLNAVIVEIQKIYAGGIDQFLQVNELSGNDELYRVGRTIWKKIVPVPYTRDRVNQWIRTGLDLSPLVADDSHSLYRITLSFDPRCVEYPGVSFTETELLDFQLENLPLTAASPDFMALGDGFWERYENRREEDRDYDNWYENRDNPAHPAFYHGNYDDGDGTRTPSRNFLVSDLGIIAQRDVNNRLTVAVSNLLTAEPVADAAVTVYDFQLQKIAEGKTDGSGLAAITITAEGFLVVAESRSVKGYLKLQGASTMPVSHFDVTGQAVQKGVKGFIYGERGVWRPGDAIHLTFILQDKDNVLPDDHPVVLRLFDPSGRLVKTVSNASPVGSFYAFTLATGAEDPTGAYTARISVGGVSFSKELPVETVKANRLKIGIGFGAGVTEITTAPATADLDVKWLHGAPAGNMRANVGVQLTAGSTSFPDHKDYVFDDPVRVFKAETKEVFDGALDASGKAGFTMHLGAAAAAPGRLTASFKTRIFEPGGNIDTDTFSMPFHPYAQYVGVRIPDADKGDGWLNVEEPHAVKIALVDTTGAPVASGEVEVDVYEIGWRWWWDRHDDNIADFLGTKEYTLVSSTRVKVAKGAAEYSLKFAERVWGRYLVRVKDLNGRHATGRICYMRWPGWYYSSSETGGDEANVLVFSADKPAYLTGETARITIPTAEKGKALVSIENNGRLISTEWIDTKPGQTIYSLKCTEKMTPNVYVHVSLVQPHGQTVNDRPIRMFGMIPLTVENPDTRLKPLITTADVYQPDSQAQVTVAEASGKAMTYTLAIVDEGLLNLTRFTTPNPWNQFYKRDATGVNTFDTYGMVAAAYGGTLEKLLAVGGGDEGEGAEGRKANRFPPMVRFLGPFTLAQGKKVEHVIDIPQYIGAVRVMVVAGAAGAYGMAEKEVTVKKPVMIYATLPRVISVTETCALPVTIFAMEAAIKSVNVKVKTQGKISVSGASQQMVGFTGPGEKQASFTLTAGNGPGLAVVEVTATSGSVTSTQQIEIDVRVPTSPVTVVDALVLKKGESRAHSVVLPGIAGTNSVVMEVSKIAPINLERRLRYLIEYPYGCVEQTTSAAFPQLYLEGSLTSPQRSPPRCRRTCRRPWTGSSASRPRREDSGSGRVTPNRPPTGPSTRRTSCWRRRSWATWSPPA